MSERRGYPATGLRASLPTWLRSPLERAYLEGYRRAIEDHKPIIKDLERALRQAQRR